MAELFAQLEDLAEQLKGEVMIFELAQHAQKFLHEHNKPSYGSFYDEMLSRNQAKEKSAMEEKQMKEDKERQVILHIDVVVVFLVIIVSNLYFFTDVSDTSR